MAELSRNAVREPASGAVALASLEASINLEVRSLARQPHEVLARIQQHIWTAANSGAFEPWTSAGPGAPPKSTMLRGGGRLRKWRLQLFRIADRTSHPPHCHDNLASCLVSLSGRVLAREYDRDRATETRDSTVLKLVSEQEMAPGESLLTTEDYRNCHWFGAVDGPALAVNFKASGYFRLELFRFKVRRYVDARAATAAGARVAFLDAGQAHARYGGDIL